MMRTQREAPLCAAATLPIVMGALLEASRVWQEQIAGRTWALLSRIIHTARPDKEPSLLPPPYANPMNTSRRPFCIFSFIHFPLHYSSRLFSAGRAGKSLLKKPDEMDWIAQCSDPTISHEWINAGPAKEMNHLTRTPTRKRRGKSHTSCVIHLTSQSFWQNAMHIKLDRMTSKYGLK